MPPVPSGGHAAGRPPRVTRYLPLPGEPLVLPDLLARVPGLFEIPLVQRPLGYTYLYFLCQRTGPAAPGWKDTLLVDYVGQSTQVAKRIYDHAMQRDREGKPPMERAFGIGVPVERANAVEEALIRLMQPAYCRPRGISPTGGERMRGKDREALAWLGFDER